MNNFYFFKKLFYDDSVKILFSDEIFENDKFVKTMCFKVNKDSLFNKL